MKYEKFMKEFKKCKEDEDIMNLYYEVILDIETAIVQQLDLIRFQVDEEDNGDS